MSSKNIIVNLLIFLLVLIICLGGVEYGFRKIIFGTNPKFKSWRKPELYADYFNDDDYWKLYHIFGGEYGAPKDPTRF